MDRGEGGAAALVGGELPIGGSAAAQLATRFAAQELKAPPAAIADALISAYCARVVADKSADPARQRAWMLDFGTQVIETLQKRAVLAEGGG